MTIEMTEDTVHTETSGIKEVNLADLKPYFTIPPGDTETRAEEQRLLDEFVKEHTPNGERVERALTVMRAKPFHRGHRLLIEAAERVANEVVVGIGSANQINADNPFSPEDTEFLIREGLKDNPELLRRVKFVYLDDFYHLPQPQPNWGEATTKKVKEEVGDFSVVVGNSGWVKEYFEKEKRVLGITPLKRDIYKGEVIRAELRNRKILNPNGLHKIRR